ncbi:MAG TPA: arginase family protein [Candidatus Binatia bacterium]|nr:arginase family protein [Candidatus Binatia bacterium]
MRLSAGEWLGYRLRRGSGLAVLGAPISRASISPSEAWSTPLALRRVLRRLPTWDGTHDLDLLELSAADLGDVEGDLRDASADPAHQRIAAAVADAYQWAYVLAVIGGDNSLTKPAVEGCQAAHPELSWGLLTLDAHHDCRPVTAGSTNGTPVRELIEGGLPGGHVAQIGIHPWANAAEDAAWARDQGVDIHPLAEVRCSGIRAAVEGALSRLREHGVTAVWADLDLDVLDAAHAPACLNSMPGGLEPTDLIEAAHLLGREPMVLGMDLTEVDASADIADRTVRLMATALLSFASGVALRVRAWDAEG